MTPVDYTGELFVLAGILFTALLGWIGSILVKRMREPVRIEALWEKIDEMSREIYGDDKTGTLGLKKRLDNSESRNVAQSRIIRSLARQWPLDHIPHLNPDWLSELEEDTVPPSWMLSPRSGSTQLPPVPPTRTV